MRRTLVSLAVLAAIALSGCGMNAAVLPQGCSAGSISAESAKDHDGQTVTVCYTVATVGAGRSNTTFINSHDPFKGYFVAVVFSAARSNVDSSVGGLSTLRGKVIEVNGRVQMYNGAPEIIVNSGNQIRVVR